MDKDEYKKETGLNFETLLKKGVMKQIYYEKIKKALEIAWRTRDFEIKMYFCSSYLVLFFVILIGSLFSLAWVLTNLSSKFWQSNWEYHINFLESEISGDMYGTVLYKKGRGFHPSISKINFCASCVILLVRIILLIHNLVWNYIKTMPLFASMLNSPLIFKFVVLLFFCGIFIYLFKCLSKPPKDNEVYRLD